jgi:NAD-dependent SIR2 family protein deacetylase
MRFKKCSCTKPLSEFYKDKAARDGHRPECKDCAKVLRHERYLRERDASIERVRAWRRANSERYRETQARYRKLRVSEQRADHLKRTFGLTLEAYEDLLALQHGACAVCNATPRRIALHVDHDHETGEIRGLLCFRCNNALGLLREDVVILERALQYVGLTSQERFDTFELETLAKTRAGELARTPG